MNYHELRRGTLKVLFLIWCVISLASIIKMIQGISENDYDPIYITITSINIVCLLILCIFKICKFFNKIKKKNTINNYFDNV